MEITNAEFVTKKNENFYSCHKCQGLWFEQVNANKYEEALLSIGQSMRAISASNHVLLRCLGCSTLQEPHVSTLNHGAMSEERIEMLDSLSGVRKVEDRK